MKFGMWSPHTLQMVMGVRERRPSPRARDPCAIYTLAIFGTSGRKAQRRDDGALVCSTYVYCVHSWRRRPGL